MNMTFESFKRWCKPNTWVRIDWEHGSVHMGINGEFNAYWWNDRTSYPTMYEIRDYVKSLGAKLYELDY